MSDGTHAADPEVLAEERDEARAALAVAEEQLVCSRTNNFNDLKLLHEARAKVAAWEAGREEVEKACAYLLETRRRAYADLDDARAIARRLRAMIRSLQTHGDQYTSDEPINDFDALSWANDDAGPRRP